ncbi:MAG: hypothetical protein ACYCO0_05220 [Candidatus Micrarchaeaceae archaeon]
MPKRAFDLLASVLTFKMRTGATLVVFDIDDVAGAVFCPAEFVLKKKDIDIIRINAIADIKSSLPFFLG